MLALTIRFCFPLTSSSPSRIRTGLRPTFSARQKGYRTALAHLGDPQGRSRHRRLQGPVPGGRFAPSARIGATEAETPNGRSTRKVFENSSPSCMISSGKGLCVA